MSKNDNRWLHYAMTERMALELYELGVKFYGPKRVRLVVEFLPNSVMKTVDNGYDAVQTIDNLKAAIEEREAEGNK